MGTIVTKGKITKTLQPGWTIEADGFGLLTSRLTFKCQSTEAAGSRPKSGDAHPEDSRLQCHRSSYTINGQLATITAEYVGIESGQRTKIQISSSTSSSSQPIQAHKSFPPGTKFKPSGIDKTSLSACGWDGSSYPEGNADAVKFGLVGVKSFLSPDIVFNCTLYTSARAEVSDAMTMVGKSFLSMPGMEEVILPKTQVGISAYHDRFALLTAASYEQFAHLFKIDFTIRIASGGWNNLVYEKHN